MELDADVGVVLAFYFAGRTAAGYSRQESGINQVMGLSPAHLAPPSAPRFGHRAGLRTMRVSEPPTLGVAVGMRTLLGMRLCIDDQLECDPRFEPGTEQTCRIDRAARRGEMLRDPAAHAIS